LIGSDALAEGRKHAAGGIRDPERQRIGITVAQHPVEALDQVTCFGPTIRQIVDARVLLTAPPALLGIRLSYGSPALPGIGSC
jgi:hypothetical protein